MNPLSLSSQAWEMFEVFLRPSTANFVKFLTQESMINPRLANSRREWHMRASTHMARSHRTRNPMSADCTIRQ